MRGSFTNFVLGQLAISSALILSRGAAEAVSADPHYFEQSIRPLLNEYCLKCHSTEKQKGDLDLERFGLLKEVMRHPKIWQQVAEQIGIGEMPPVDKPQPATAEKDRLTAWVHSVLDAAALAQAGDPGPVVLRRLSNAEYTYTVRDLTGVASLDPVREFPIDGAAGEGFMNTGNALVMSPSLITKYLDAGKAVASHAVLLPDGIRFSPATTPRDWTDEALAEIRAFYREFTEISGGDNVGLYGIVQESTERGRLPLEKYLLATMAWRDLGKTDLPGLEALARDRGLSPKYLATLWNALSGKEPSQLFDRLRARWRTAKAGDAAALAAEIDGWQDALWKFSRIGHIGRAGGPKAWMEPASPLMKEQELRLTMPVDAEEVTLYLAAGDAGDGNAKDFAVWQNPRLLSPGRPDLLLRDLREVSGRLAEERHQFFKTTAKSLVAAAEAGLAPKEAEVAELARKHGVEPASLQAWLKYPGIAKQAELPPGIIKPVFFPADSLLARWEVTGNSEERQKLAEAVQKLLTSAPPAAKDSPDALLYRQLSTLKGPWFAGASATGTSVSAAQVRSGGKSGQPAWGLEPGAFGPQPGGSAINANSLAVQAPSVIEIRLPADLVAGCEFVTTGLLDQRSGPESTVQLQVMTSKPTIEPRLVPSKVSVAAAGGYWNTTIWKVSYPMPILVNEGGAAHQRIEAEFEQFRQLFPAALCYTKIVPVDEVVTLTLYHREDDQLARLMLDEAQQAKLNRLWDELHFISQDALKLVDVFEQLWEYSTQNADPKALEPMRKPVQERAAAFAQLLVDTQPKHMEAVVDHAGSAYRRPLTEDEARELRGLYRKLREQELPHEEAVRLTLARVYTAPAFLYRLEKAGPGAEPATVSDWELANRLSYFLWSSMPDEELLAAAAAGKLRQPEGLAAQARRMLGDPRTRRMATEFACQWLHIRDFDTLDEKSERHFPTFTALREDMYEESILFFTDLFQRDGSVLSMLDADYTFLNEALAKHYGIPAVTGAEWRRVDGVRKFARGGILGQATILAKQSGASRTSPILRGNWVAEVLLGDKLPRPPKDVPPLPEDDGGSSGLTVRQIVERHTSDPRCYGCHRRIDAFGYALENFDAIGRWRQKEVGDQLIETKVKVMDGTEFDGVEGLRHYLLSTKRDIFLKQFCRKLLGYSLGRGVQLSDDPLLAQMMAELEQKDYRFGAAVEAIVKSRQFREIRGREAAYDD